MPTVDYVLMARPLSTNEAWDGVPIQFYNGSSWVDKKTAAKLYSREQALETRKMVMPPQNHTSTVHPLHCIREVSDMSTPKYTILPDQRVISEEKP